MRFGRVVRLLIFILPGLAVLQTSEAGAETDLFQQLLEESGLQFARPDGFTGIVPAVNPVLSYERALRHNSVELEIRYIIRPLGRLAIDYTDPHNAAPEPNHLFPLLFESLITQLSNGASTYNSEYPQSQAQELFNADWAAAAVFDVNSSFTDDYSEALMVAIHKNSKADAYTVFLYNEYAEVKELIKTVLPILAFAP